MAMSVGIKEHIDNPWRRTFGESSSEFTMSSAKLTPIARGSCTHALDAVAEQTEAKLRQSSSGVKLFKVT